MSLKSEISNAFNAQAHLYDQAAVVQQEIGRRLFSRLDYLKLQPSWVLDLGCGSGLFSKCLKQRYPKAHIVGLDCAYNMLQQAYLKQTWLRKWSLVQTDMCAMPFPSGLFDLVFANQSIHWGNPVMEVMQEINRVMKADGCLMFSTLGPDTFSELRRAWSNVDGYAHINEFMDMHDWGDLLLTQHFLEPVVDMETITLRYRSLPSLLQALKAQGVRNVNPHRNGGLTGRKVWQRFEQAMRDTCTDQGHFPLTYEVVYGHAWKGMMLRAKQGTEAFVPVSQLRGRTLR
jgi:malonyl-CoA O-methyltransferase